MPKLAPEVGQGDIRLRSMVETLQFGQQKGFKQIIFGHLGRKEKDKPIGSLAKVATRLGKVAQLRSAADRRLAR